MSRSLRVVGGSIWWGVWREELELLFDVEVGVERLLDVGVENCEVVNIVLVSITRTMGLPLDKMDR